MKSGYPGLGALCILLFSAAVPAQDGGNTSNDRASTGAAETTVNPANTAPRYPSLDPYAGPSAGALYRSIRQQQRFDALRNGEAGAAILGYPPRNPAQTQAPQPQPSVSQPKTQEAPANRNFNGQNLIGRNFAGKQLSNLSFESSTLQSANFAGANLDKVNLSGADLRGANFQGASLTDVKLQNAILDNAIWTDGRRCGVDSIGECR